MNDFKTMKFVKEARDRMYKETRDKTNDEIRDYYKERANRLYSSLGKKESRSTRTKKRP